MYVLINLDIKHTWISIRSREINYFKFSIDPIKFNSDIASKRDVFEVRFLAKHFNSSTQTWLHLFDSVLNDDLSCSSQPLIFTIKLHLTEKGTLAVEFASYSNLMLAITQNLVKDIIKIYKNLDPLYSKIMVNKSIHLEATTNDFIILNKLGVPVFITMPGVSTPDLLNTDQFVGNQCTDSDNWSENFNFKLEVFILLF
ncbi:MAG: hypothetical protein MHPSP_001262 [Paramarteilia canceri]